MFKSIVVGTDGSDTATQAVRQAVDLAGAVGAKVDLVSAYAPVPEARLREERKQAPEDLQWAINPREDVDATLEAAAAIAAEAGGPGATFPRPGPTADAIRGVAEVQGAVLGMPGDTGVAGAGRL